jgi:hypothetical protein
MQFSFGDRFSFNNAAFTAIENAGIETATDQQLITASPELANMARMVRRFSVLLKNTAAKEIYYAITDHADPEIALIISTAKNSDGSWRYPNTNDVKRFMFSPPSGNLLNEERNKFAEGIRRISSALAAAELISAYATLKEQLSHAEALKEKAIAELKMLIDIATINTSEPEPTTEESEVKGQLYFEQLSFTLTNTLYLYVNFPGTAVTLTAIVYSAGTLSTARIVNDIADKINEASLTDSTVNILAAPVLSGEESTHYLELSPRTAVADRTAYLVTIQFKSSTNAGYSTLQLPFRWGVDLSNLSTYPLNSILLLVRSSYFVASRVGDTESTKVPVILYIKRDATITPPSTSNYTIRFPVTSDDAISTTFNRLTGTEQTTLDSSRPAQFAESLVNTITANKDSSYMVAAIVRNDPPNLDDPIAVVELFAWSITNPQVTLILDILSLPADLLISLGDYNQTYSLYSNRARSVKVKSTYELSVGVTNETQLDLSGTPKMVGFARSRLLDELNDATRHFQELHDQTYFY